MTLRPFRILSLNGGGVRGVFQAVYLSRIAHGLGLPLWQCFDLVAGTSIGAINALAVGLDVDLEKLVDLYRGEAGGVFRASLLAAFLPGPRYDQSILKRRLLELFGPKRLRDCKTSVLVTAAALDQYCYRVFTTLTDLDLSDGDMLATEVALASAAAPTYFGPVRPTGHERSYVDGGVWANSPSIVALLHVHHYLGVPFESMRLLSVGTGDFVRGATHADVEGMRTFSVRTIRFLFELMFGSQASFADKHAEQLVGSQNVARVNPVLKTAIPLDDFGPALSQLPPLAEAEAENTLRRVRDLFLLKPEDLELRRRGKSLPQKLVPREAVAAAGLTGFYASRRHYHTFRAHAPSMADYAVTAKKTLVIISVNLMTGLPFEGLRSALEKRLESKTESLTVTISLLDPREGHLMAAMAPILEKTEGELAQEIVGTLRKLWRFRHELSEGAQARLQIRVHKAIPSGSAIMLDHEDQEGRIQVEAKPYKAPLMQSFAFEVSRTGTDSLYEALARGYRDLLQDGEPADFASEPA